MSAVTGQGVHDAGYGVDSHKWWVLGVIVMGSFMSILDSTVVNIALPKLMSFYSTDVHGAQWVLTSYLLALAIVIPLTGYLDETYGGKRVYMITLTLFTIASALCGLSWSLSALIGFRIIQGLGGGLIQPLGMSLLLREFRPEERGTALGFYGIPIMLAPAIGPTVGGYLVEYVDWRFIFFINVPIGIMAVLAASRILHEAPLHRDQKLDRWGIALVAIGSAALLLGIDNGPTDGWGSTWVIGELILGVSCLAAFIFVELTVKQPLLDLRLFKEFNFSAALFVTLIVQIALFGATFLLPLFLQNLRGLGAMETGLLLVPQALTVALVMPISGRIFDRFGPRLVLVPGITLLALATYRFGTLSLQTTNLEIIGNLLLRGLGMGLAMMPATTAAMNAVPRQSIPRASALANALQRIAGSFGTAVMSTILTSRQNFQFASLAQTQTLFNFGVRTTLAKAQAMPTLSYLPAPYLHQLIVMMLYRNVAVQAAVRSFDDTFLVAAVICLPAIAAAFLVRNVGMRRVGAAEPVLAE
ncbi:MAG TPA: DHA2 family efflux MFS transporter permease subunit [Chloroflexota bacterium]|nr:DHA2 family efflux MFS transporter permease subunit [Chloroflexota bacterium]